MKTLKSFALILLMVAFVSAAYSQGNKISWVQPMAWDETVAPIDCIGPYTGEIEMHITWFYTGKIVNKASGTITDSDGNDYAVESLFNCQNFVHTISASGNSNQSWTFRVRSVDTGKLVATVHFTFHYTEDEVDPHFTFVNAQTTCY